MDIRVITEAPLPPIDVFTGEDATPEVVERFAEEVRAAWRLVSKEDNTRKLDILFSACGREVRGFLRLQNEQDPDIALRNIVEAYGESRNPNDLLLELLNSCQSATESIKTYATRIHGMYRNLIKRQLNLNQPPISDFIIRDTFLNGLLIQNDLKTTISVWLLERPKTTFSSLLEFTEALSILHRSRVTPGDPSAPEQNQSAEPPASNRSKITDPPAPEQSQSADPSSPASICQPPVSAKLRHPRPAAKPKRHPRPRPLMSIRARPTKGYVRSLPRLMDLQTSPTYYVLLTSNLNPDATSFVAMEKHQPERSPSSLPHEPQSPSYVTPEEQSPNSLPRDSQNDAIDIEQTVCAQMDIPVSSNNRTPTNDESRESPLTPDDSVPQMSQMFTPFMIYLSILSLIIILVTILLKLSLSESLVLSIVCF